MQRNRIMAFEHFWALLIDHPKWAEISMSKRKAQTSEGRGEQSGGYTKRDGGGLHSKGRGNESHCSYIE